MGGEDMSSRYGMRASFGYRPLLPITPLIIQARASRPAVRSRLVFRHAMRGGERGVSFLICRHGDNLLIGLVLHIRTYFPLFANEYKQRLWYILYVNNDGYHARTISNPFVRPLSASKQIDDIGAIRYGYRVNRYICVGK